MLSRIPAASTPWRKARSQPGPVAPENALDNSNQRAADGSPPQPKRPEDAGLGELNESLAVLAAIFPDIQIEVFREMLSSFSEESRLQVVTENILKHKVKWVQGRWRVPPPEPDQSNGESVPAAAPRSSGEVPASEMFRSAEYKAAVKAAFYQDFKSLSHSAIKAVLAEHNHSYIHARPTLLDLAAKSWRVSLTNWVLRRKTPSATANPLIIWQDHGKGIVEPVLIPTASDELNEELDKHIIAPLRQRHIEEQIKSDKVVAEAFNAIEAEEANAFLDCECCFLPQTFENIAVCTAEQHYICFTCIRFTVKEALYGQGWAKSTDNAKCSLRCIAATSGNNECKGHVSRDLLQAALTGEEGGRDLWTKFEDRFVQDSFRQSQINLCQCPFCPYGEYSGPIPTPDKFNKQDCIYPLVAIGIIAALAQQTFESVLPRAPLGMIFLCFALNITWNWRKLAKTLSTHIHSPAVNTTKDPNHGQKFICRNPDCGRASCLRCLAPWHDMHICHASQRRALRTYIEAATTNAVKRTCPRCHLSFVKSSGCNKLVCVCGYAMCYVCRAEIRSQEGYAHFCPHFRPDPGAPCTECERCDLYKAEDEDEVIARAKENAVKEWRDKEGAGSGKGVTLDLDCEVDLDFGLRQDEIKQRPSSRRGRHWL